MTPILVTVQGDIVTSALENIQSQINRPLQATPGDKLEFFGDQLQSALKESWYKIGVVVNDCMEYGWEYVKESVLVLQQNINGIANGLGDLAAEFKRQLSDYVRNLIREIFQSLLDTLQHEVMIGNLRYKLSNVELEHKLIISASVQASVQSLCQFLATGELLVRGSYSV